ncbi:HAMP domain-containing sensor histidine kinase [Streptomyces sp. NPDC046821]|uniref:sensor histidine kinase n=1 Tax=Streptomyces sp. NPDC046821 TaxID=3154702 RepID=UPI0034111BEF
MRTLRELLAPRALRELLTARTLRGLFTARSLRDLLTAHTLRGQLAVLALVSTAAWVALLTIAFNIALSARLRGEADELLHTRAAAVASTLEARHGKLVIRDPADDRALDVGAWVYEGRAAIERPSAPDVLQRDADGLARRVTTFTGDSSDSAWRLASRPVIHHGRLIGTVVVSVSLDPYRSTARTALVGSATLGVLLLAGVALVTRKMVGRALRPVAEMGDQAARWSERGAAERFGTEGRPAELASLAGHLDELLDRLAAVLRHEQQQMAELSHELRTPLSRIVAETEWLTSRPRDRAGQQASHEVIADSAATMWQICETLLSESRTRTDRTPGRCELPAYAEQLVEEYGRDHPETPKLVVRAGLGAPMTAGASDAVIARILTPLLDNARRYAASTIVLECAATTHGVELSVTDDGPGVPTEAGEAVFEPGRRACPDEGHDGAGLGLALSRRLARAAGGDIALDPPDDRGARFVVRLPFG